MKWRRRHIDKALRKNLDLFLLCSFQKQSNRWFFSIEIVEDICSAYGNKCRRKEGHCEVGYLLYSYICGPINKERIITGDVTRLRCLWQMPLLTPALVCYLRWSQCWSSTFQESVRQARIRIIPHTKAMTFFTRISCIFTLFSSLSISVKIFSHSRFIITLLRSLIGRSLGSNSEFSNGSEDGFGVSRTNWTVLSKSFKRDW